MRNNGDCECRSANNAVCQLMSILVSIPRIDISLNFLEGIFAVKQQWCLFCLVVRYKPMYEGS